MTISLLTNIPSMTAQVNVNRTQALFDASVNRLSSGLRIVTPSDDAAGLAISSQLTALVLSLEVAQRNANDAVSALQVGDGGYAIIIDILTRMRELAVESSNVGTLNAGDRSDLDAEFQDLITEVERITAVTTYNGVTLIASGGFASTFQVGADSGVNNQIAFSFAAADTTTLSISGSDISTAADAEGVLASIDAAISTIATARANLGAAESQVNFAIETLSSQIINMSAANARIKDVDIASETATFTSMQILMQAGVSVLALANQEPSAALTLINGG